MKIILDYGGTIVDLIDESEYSKILETESGPNIPGAGYIAYKSFSLGILEDEDEYITTLSTLTGVPEEKCWEYLEERRDAVELPEDRKRVLEELADEHSLILFTDQVRIWIERSLEGFGIRELFDEIIVSSELGVEKPHPKGYARAVENLGDEEVVMVSDEINDDLMMANYFGITTVWIRNEREEVYGKNPTHEGDYIIEDLVELPPIIEEIQGISKTK